MGLGGHQETDVYISTLPEVEKKRALDELREDDNVRDQSLHQMREWVTKHPNIKKCRTGNFHQSRHRIVHFSLELLQTPRFCCAFFAPRNSAFRRPARCWSGTSPSGSCIRSGSATWTPRTRSWPRLLRPVTWCRSWTERTADW